MKVLFKSFVLCALLFFCSMKVFSDDRLQHPTGNGVFKVDYPKNVLSLGLLPIRMAISMQSS